MVFPSLIFQVDQGMVSQLSAWAVLTFSFLLYRFKKILFSAITILILFILIQNRATAAIAMPSYNQNSCMNYVYCANNANYYGRPYGYNPSVYFYPQLPFQSFWNPQQNYFPPHAPSPYQSFDCPFCNQQQQQQFQPNSFPNFYQHPGGGAS